MAKTASRLPALATALAGALCCASPAGAAPVPVPSDLRDRLGVAHADGTYALTREPYLVEGAKTILECGSRVIKVWMSPTYASKYRHNTEWPKVGGFVELCKTEPYKTLFDLPFTTYIFETETFPVPKGDRKAGDDGDPFAEETRQVYELAKHLHKTYGSKRKTFVLQNWEGDWAIISGYDREKTPTAGQVDRMVGLLNARQAGIDKARKECGAGMRVYHAAEVNLVRKGMEGKPCVTTLVFPRTHCDLYSYSAYDTCLEGNPDLVRQALDFIAKNAPDSPTFGAKNVYIGEFGIPESEHGPQECARAIGATVKAATDFGCPYMIYWQVYDNEPKRRPVQKPEDCRGWWLKRPDGTTSYSWNILRKLMGINEGKTR